MFSKFEVSCFNLTFSFFATKSLPIIALFALTIEAHKHNLKTHLHTNCLIMDWGYYHQCLVHVIQKIITILVAMQKVKQIPHWTLFPCHALPFFVKGFTL
jgi:hypothetical protein